MSMRALWGAALIAALAPGAGASPVPEKITYPGTLKVNGVPDNGQRRLGFQFSSDSSGGPGFGSDGNWTSSQTVTISNGLIKVVLGDAGNPLSSATVVAIPANYLTVSVDGVELDPHDQMLSAPFALKTASVAGLTVSQAGEVSIGSPLAALNPPTTVPKLKLGGGAIRLTASTPPDPAVVAPETAQLYVEFVPGGSGGPCDNAGPSGEDLDQLYLNALVRGPVPASGPTPPGVAFALASSGCF